MYDPFFVIYSLFAQYLLRDFSSLEVFYCCIQLFVFAVLAFVIYFDVWNDANAFERFVVGINEIEVAGIAVVAVFGIVAEYAAEQFVELSWQQRTGSPTGLTTDKGAVGQTVD